jgi:hypothetical protein
LATALRNTRALPKDRWHFPVSVLPSCVICVGVHNWADSRREKLHAAGMNRDRTEETVIEVCCFLDEQISLLNSQNQDY